MEEEGVNKTFPDLKELENKIGRKTPESLLRWMRGDAALGGEWCSESAHLERTEDGSTSDSLTYKIRNLKLEMGCLRTADVRILRQLVSVHEGIEAVRWLLEERCATPLASRSSSLTGSQSSLAESPGTGESPGPTGLEDPERELASDLISGCNSYFDMLTNNSTDERPSCSAESSALCFSQGASGQIWSSKGHANSKLSQLSEAAPPLDSKSSAEPTGTTVATSSKDIGRGRTLGGADQAETPQHGLPEDRLRATESDAVEDKQSPPSSEGLLGYDAQWRWVESQDDVTFL